ncbi:DCL family protein [Reyranella aquatilis]|uniref:DCL family protein n=1 Tax=Reyranella aquatilis TaxID=2035356 RepID=A0ABS8L287_9HYPH|nr:DCL family protein [Reyranella aquatilis]MCC8432439.1 DCL family protein [Reyranella aquatilis]
MRRGHPVDLGPLSFSKKGDAAKHLREMLGRYDVGDGVSSDDAVVLEAALRRHPEASAKIGVGIKNFSVRGADFGTKCFWVNRTDGSTEDFSINACIYEKVRGRSR